MTTYIGVDVGKKSIQLYIPATSKSYELPNTQAGFNSLVSYLNKHYNDLQELIIVFEPTGGYERALRDFLTFHQLNFTIVHPTKVRQYARAKGWLAKTDSIDSKLLHDYGSCFSLSVKAQYNTDEQQVLHGLIRRREQLMLCQNQEIARLDTISESIVKQSLEQHLSFLEEQVKNIDMKIRELCNDVPEIKDTIEKLTSIPGVGIGLATNVVCELPEIGKAKFTQLVSLIGLAPFARDSGAYRGKRSIFAGKNRFRKIIYMAAVASLRCNTKLKAFYDRLIANHKPPKVALVAVMRKLLGIMHALIKNNSFWSYNYAIL